MKFCPECGAKLRKNAVKCPKCGKNLKEEKKEENKTTKAENTNDKKGLVIASFVIGIVAIVLSFTLTFLVIPGAILGLIFGILGKAPRGKKIAGIIMNSIAIVLSIIMLIVWVVVISNMMKDSNNIFIKFYRFIGMEEKVSGDWKCKLYDNKESKYLLTLELDEEKNFKWADYNSPKYNYVKGTYDYTTVAEETADSKRHYLVNLHPKTMYLYGRKRTARDTTYKMFITKKDHPRKIKLINSRTYNTYYCDEK